MTSTLLDNAVLQRFFVNRKAGYCSFLPPMVWPFLHQSHPRGMFPQLTESNLPMVPVSIYKMCRQINNFLSLQFLLQLCFRILSLILGLMLRVPRKSQADCLWLSRVHHEDMHSVHPRIIPEGHALPLLAPVIRDVGEIPSFWAIVSAVLKPMPFISNARRYGFSVTLEIASFPYVLKILTAREVPTPYDCRKTIISRITFWSAHALTTQFMRFSRCRVTLASFPASPRSHRRPFHRTRSASFLAK